MREPTPLQMLRVATWRRVLPLLAAASLGLSACQPQHDNAWAAATPPVGHYEGTITPAGQTAVRASLDIRHPSPGHYEAELTVPETTLSFVADTVAFENNRLQLVRPARPGQTLTLSQDGDFWRGTLALDSARLETLLVKRGGPTPTAYRVEELPQANGSAWLFAPADTGTPGPALALLPDSATAAAVPYWADALARQGIIVLALPAVGRPTEASEAAALQVALRVLRGTAGADTATVGAWASGARATLLATALAGNALPGVHFFISQNADVPATTAALYRQLAARTLPVLGLYAGNTPATRAAAGRLRAALGSRHGASVRTYRTAAADLLLPGSLTPRFGPGLPDDVTEWLRAR